MVLRPAHRDLYQGDNLKAGCHATRCAQVFGKDTIMNLGGRETAESREQWLEDVDMQVALAALQRPPKTLGSAHAAAQLTK